MLDRRRFLVSAGAAALLPAFSRLTLAASSSDHRLVIIVLRGAVDGLDVCRPVGDPAFSALRPDTAKDKNIGLDGRFAMHPALAPLEPLFGARELSFVHAVATPYRERSHFEGQDILEQGGNAQSLNDGWLNRLLDLVPKPRAVDIGTGESILLNGPNPVTNWYPETLVNLQQDSLQFLEGLYADDPLLSAALQGINAQHGADMSGDNTDRGVSNPEIARLAARFLREDARVAAFSINGWDTHRNQVNRMERQLTELSATLLALRQSLGPVWAKTAVAMCSEFGRTARWNGTGGTDHGTGGLAILAGGLLANGQGGKVLGKWPGLAELYEDRDLMPTSDVRHYLGALGSGMFGIAPSAIAAKVFPGLDMASPVRLL